MNASNGSLLFGGIEEGSEGAPSFVTGLLFNSGRFGEGMKSPQRSFWNNIAS
jgi:hypothetical protein